MRIKGNIIEMDQEEIQEAIITGLRTVLPELNFDYNPCNVAFNVDVEEHNKVNLSVVITGQHEF